MTLSTRVEGTRVEGTGGSAGRLRALAVRSRRDPTARRWPLGRWLLVIGAIMALFAVAAVIIGGLAVNRLTEARSAVIDLLQPAQQAVQSLTTALVDQETGVRGYSLTAREDFLQPYIAGQQAAQQATAEIRTLAASGDLGSLDADLNNVLARADAWRTGFAEPTIAQVRASGRPASPIDPQVGKADFDAVRAAAATQQGHLDQVLAQGEDRLRNDATSLLVVFVCIAAGLVVFLVGISILLRRAVISPVSRLAAEVRQVASGDVQRRIEAGGPREVVELAEDVDAMRRHILAELATTLEVNRQLDIQSRELGRSNSDLEQFAYVASHDLQEPLRKVSSFCQLLQTRYAGQLDERADTYIAFAVDGARRMQELINDLLAFSRVGRNTSGLRPVDCDEALTRALTGLATAIEAAGAQVSSDELPEVLGEASLLTLVFQNLVGNAIKFRGEDSPEIRVSVRPDGPDWEFAVADNGIGVDAEYADKIFIIFQRLHPKNAYPGTGIGLAMCRKIVEYHGGRIWLDLEATGGSTFRFTLPAIKEDEDTEDGDV